MPLTKAQVAVLKNPAVRQRLPAKKNDFAYADQLLKDVGESCPRLPAVWDRIFYGLDQPTAKWLNVQFPGLGFQGAQAGSEGPKPPPAPHRSLVSKAIEVIQSYKKTP